jgi:4-amino-4-deoxy-L-arabinose transferase-like glycosyltransferase
MRGVLICGAALVCLHTAAMLYRFGSIPNIPVFGDEIVINDPAIAVSRGQGLIAPSFTDSISGIDKLYAHFPPVYIFLQAAVFRVLGVSGYSLRLLTTVFSIASVLAFLVIVYRLCGYGVMKQRTGLFVSCLYALSAPVIILHRISRMESLVELLSLVSLYCALKLTFGHMDEGDNRTTIDRKAQIGLLVVAAVCAGLALASHPEAVNAILPALLIFLFTNQVRTIDKSVFLALLVLTPAAIWIGTYGSRSWIALVQMASIAKEKAPDPSMPQFGMDLLRKASSSEHDLMVFLFFALTVVVLVWALLQVIRSAGRGQAGTNQANPNVRTIQKALAIAVPVTFVVLIFFLPASITRYEVIYPVYLLLIAVLPVPYTNRRAIRPYVIATVAVLIVGQFLACILYLAQNRISAEGPMERYNFVLDCIPDADAVAASPQLWLAFQRRDRHFSLLYPGLDGMAAWEKTSSDPLGRFDVILLTDYVKDDLDRYAPLSSSGKVEQDVPIGRRVLRVYSRPGALDNCKDKRLVH